MNSPHNEDAMVQEIDATLAALAAVRPRDGLEQRVLARIATAPATSWFQRWVPALPGSQRWMLAAASAVIVASGVTIGLHHNRPVAPMQAPAVAAHAPRAAQQPIAASSGIAVNSHPLQSHTIRTRHRGVRPAYRATHDRALLPRGTAVPMRPRVMSTEQ